MTPRVFEFYRATGGKLLVGAEVGWKWTRWWSGTSRKATRLRTTVFMQTAKEADPEVAKRFLERYPAP